MVSSDVCLRLFLVIAGIISVSSWTSPSTLSTSLSSICLRPRVDTKFSSFSGPSRCCLGVVSAGCRLSPLGSSSSVDNSDKMIIDLNNGGDKSARVRTVRGPDLATKPDYENIHGPMGRAMDKLFLTVFRTQLAKHVGVDSNLPKDDFRGLVELTAALNARYSDRRQVQIIAHDTLFSLFPSWLPGQFAILFAKPFPQFSARMNAWATRVGGTWLMGECEINDVELDDGTVYKNQGLLVKRCRFLEETGCASVCVNSCKIPTQRFFLEDMGLPLTMTPDYDTHECQFAFGVMPNEVGELDARNTPCLSRCPTSGSMREWHNGNVGGSLPSSASATTATHDDSGAVLPCAFMDKGQ